MTSVQDNIDMRLTLLQQIVKQQGNTIEMLMRMLPQTVHAVQAHAASHSDQAIHHWSHANQSINPSVQTAVHHATPHSSDQAPQMVQAALNPSDCATVVQTAQAAVALHAIQAALQQDVGVSPQQELVLSGESSQPIHTAHRHWQSSRFCV